MDHDRKIAAVRRRGCFGLGTAHVKALGALMKKKKKTKMTKLDFHRFQVRHFSNNF